MVEPDHMSAEASTTRWIERKEGNQEIVNFFPTHSDRSHPGWIQSRGINEVTWAEEKGLKDTGGMKSHLRVDIVKE